MRVHHHENSLEVAAHINNISTQNLEHGAIKVVLTGLRAIRNESEDGHCPTSDWDTINSLITERRIPNPLAGIREPLAAYAYQLPDDYGFIALQVPKYWTKHEPHLMVHIQTSNSYTGSTQTQAAVTLHNASNCCDYTIPDRCDTLPQPQHLNCAGRRPNCTTLASSLDLMSVANAVNEANVGIQVNIAQCPGISIGEFIYSKSLSIHPERCFLITIPPSQVCPPDAGIIHVIGLCIEEALSILNREGLLF